MKNISSRVILYCMLALILQGCAGVTQLSKEPIKAGKVTFIVPKNANITDAGDNLKGLRYTDKVLGGQPALPGNPVPISGISAAEGNSPEKMIYTFYNGEIYVDAQNIQRMVASSVVYTVTVNISENNHNFLVTLQPIEKQVIKGIGSYGNSFPIPDASTSDLLRYLSEPSIDYTTEIDSPYNTESIYSNFKRSLKSESFANGYRDPVTGKIFADVFMLQTGFGEKGVAKLYVATYPYKNGSKAVIRVSLPLASVNGENTIDVGEKIKSVNQELARIVNR